MTTGNTAGNGDSNAAGATLPATEQAPSDFIRDIVAADLAAGKYQKIHTRFPPEPNGYLHIGHAKSICLNFGIARQFGGTCNLRMDDTNPAKEEVEYVESILTDVRWLIDGWADQHLGMKPAGAMAKRHGSGNQVDYFLPPAAPGETQRSRVEPFYASDYFEPICEYAFELIRRGRAYVCDLSPEDTDKFRGAPDRPGQDSPWRNRPIEESLDLFTRMKAGEFPNGARTLRAKIDMGSPNIWLRDPVLYRIRHQDHHHTGNRWRIYPMYDFAHCLSDYIEGVTHSICTLEFEVHRPLYNWILGSLELPRPLPHQYEFAKLIPSYTLLSKRRLIQFVQEKLANGWDDPRMPTISGIRRRGVPASAVRRFAIGVGVTKFSSVTDLAVFDHVIRDELNRSALRRLAVLRPIQVVLTNCSPAHAEELHATNNPEDPSSGTRNVPFHSTLYIDADDFMENPPPKYFRLRPGGEVRLKYAYIIRCDEVIKDAAGQVTQLRCTADFGSRAGGPTAHRKVKGTIHWVSAKTAIDAEVRLYDRFFQVAEPDSSADLKPQLNPKSLEIVQAKCEPSLRQAEAEERYQFERVGYFCLDADSRPAATPPRLVFNRTISLKDTWAKETRKG